MRRRFLMLLVVFAALTLGGCLRLEFDLCDQDPPHPDCLDGSIDGGEDANDAATDTNPTETGAADSSASDSGSSDSGSGDATSGSDADGG